MAEMIGCILTLEEAMDNRTLLLKRLDTLSNLAVKTTNEAALLLRPQSSAFKRSTKRARRKKE
jgi:hypothetical protein